MNGFIGILGVIAVLLVLGVGLGFLSRAQFSAHWLLVAAGLVLLNDAALTNLYGLLPNLLPGTDWNWQGKLLAIAITLGIAAHPSFGWRKIGMAWAQQREGRTLTYGVVAVTVLIFLALALYFPNDPIEGESLAFQLTMPGLDEEPYYRGTLLLVLNEAFRSRRRMLGIDLGWGGVLTCVLFGMGHSFGYDDGAFSFDAMTMALTAIPSFLLLWFRERTGSLVLPIVLHNFANSISILL